MKRIFLVALALIIFLVPLAVSAANNSATAKLIQIEQDTYGAEQAGAILNRINRIEKDFYGKNMQGNMNVRINSMYDIIYGNMGTPGIFSKINALEWNTYNEVSSEKIISRIENLEREISGKTSDKPLTKRIDDLSKISFGNKKIPLAEMQLPENTLIKVALTEGLGSRNLQVGDIIEVKVVENVIIDGKLVFAKGLRGKGTVERVRKAKVWNNGKVKINFQKLNCIDGKNIEVYVGTESINEMKSQEMIGGASLIGINLKDDWNKIMVHGKNVEISAGTELYIQTKKTVNLYGLQLETAG